MKKQTIGIGLTAATVLVGGTTGVVVAAQQLQGDAIQTTTEQTTATQAIAQVSRFTLESHPQFASYQQAFTIQAEKLQISANKPDFDLPYSAMNDGDKTTFWAPSTRDDALKTEVEFTFDELVTLDQLTYVARQNVNTDSGGFPHQFEIYGAMSDEAEYTLVASGSEATATKETIAIQFPATQFKKLKFKFVETSTRTKWAHIAEIQFYQPDTTMAAMNQLFTDSSHSVLNPDYANEAALNELVAAVASHPFAAEYEAMLADAKILLNHIPIEATTATMQAFNHFENTAYSEQFKINRDQIVGITNNAGHYASQAITNAIDNDLSTYWETNKANTTTWNNEVIVEFSDAVTIDRLVYGARPDRKGFATQFEIYASPTTSGETFELLATGEQAAVNGLVEAKFAPTQMKRVKLKFVGSTQNWATLSELAFYQTDVVTEAMNELFTDSIHSALNPDYANEAVLTQLQAAVDAHPLANAYADKMRDAWTLLNHVPAQATPALTSTFSHFENEAYRADFQISTDKIASIKNNGKHYSNRVITNAIDNDPSTYWETNTSNSDTFKNEVEITFTESVTMNRLVYGARTDLKGFATKFEVYASPTATGDNFELVTTGEQNAASGLIEARFASTQMRRVKFKIIDGVSNWATLTELAFFSEDQLTDIVENDVFVDYSYTALQPAYANAEALEALQQAVLAHPGQTTLLPIVERAFAILAGETPESVVSITATQEGDMNYHAKSVLRMTRAGQNFQPTGVYGLPGEKIVIYVDGDPTSTAQPAIAFSQNNASRKDWVKTYQLKPGRNEFIVPEFDLTTSYYHTQPNPGGAMYIVNPYTPDQQATAPIITFEGGHDFPLYQEGDDEAAFIAELRAYNEKVIAADLAGDKTVIDIAEIEGSRVLISTKATSAHTVYVNEGLAPHQTTDEWADVMNTLFAFHGIDGSSEINDPKTVREHIRLMQPHGMAYASTSHVGIQSGHTASILREGIAGAWGFIHEVGHRLDNRHREIIEVTNNMDSMYMSMASGQMRDRVSYENVFAKVINQNDEETFSDGGYFVSLGAFWQLQLANENYWAEFNRLYRENQPAIPSGQAKFDYMVKYSSEVFGENLTEHFSRHGMKVSPEVEAELAATYPTTTNKYWYLHTKAWEYEGTGLATTDTAEIISVQTDGKLTLATTANDADFLGYEVYRDGEIIGFTRTHSFTDKNYDATTNASYSVIPYGVDLQAGEMSAVYESHTPILSLNQAEITLGLYANFDPRAYVSATTYDGEPIEQITIDSNVNMNQKGEYQVTYTINDEGIEVQQTLQVEVVADVMPISDLTWNSATSGWASVNKDSAVNTTAPIKLNVNGVVQTFEKGIGAAANAEIVYDLSNTNYDYFTSYVGTDKNYDVTSTSIQFIVLADGEEVYRSSKMGQNSPAEFINIPITGVKELRLIADNVDGSGSGDFASWGGAQLVTFDGKPTITGIEMMTAVPFRSEFDLLAGINAHDIEDGDITSQIQVDAGNFDVNIPGVYPVTYTITDRDGYTTTTTREITVYSQQTYISDLTWESATSGWKTVNKDSAVNTTAPIQLDLNGTVTTFEKGLGAAAQAEIVYDLSGAEYDYFTSYVGTDKNYTHSTTSIQFIILADGEEVYRSSQMGQYSPAEFVNIPVTGVKELRLIADNVDGSGSGDFASWGNAQLLTTNSKPTLTIPSHDVYEVGDVLPTDLIGTYTANDIEDGDLTANVTATGAEEVTTNKPGSYEIAYTVTDSNGNTTTQVRTIAVIDKQDYTYLTDYDWSKATQSYSSTQKDQHYSGSQLRLTDASGASVTYERGLGTHANAEIIYDLTQIDAAMFSTYIGVDRTMYNSSAASIIFEFYVDGEKVYASDVIRGKDPQQYVEINLVGAKELKLIVNNAGNGNGSDHGSFGDTKLYHVNTERADLSELTTLITELEAMDLSDYTAETVAVFTEQLEAAKALVATGDVLQSQADAMIEALVAAREQLVSTNVEVAIPDATLAHRIRQTLGLATDQPIMSHDLAQLTTLNLELSNVRNLEGLQYASNLESLNVNFSEVRDLRPLQGLTKLTDLQAAENFIDFGNATYENGQYIVDIQPVFDAAGNKLAPLAVVLSAYEEQIALPLETVIVDDKIVIDAKLLAGKASETLEVMYASEDKTFSFYSFNWLKTPSVVEANPVVDMPDQALQAAVKNTLGLAQTSELRASDIAKLTTLTSEFDYIRDLTGLEYARNLTSLNLNFNEVTDLRPLQNLPKLTTIEVNENFIDHGDADFDGQAFSIPVQAVYDRDGSKLQPLEIALTVNGKVTQIPVETVLQNDTIVIDKTYLQQSKYATIEIKYASEVTNYSTYSHHWLKN